VKAFDFSRDATITGNQVGNAALTCWTPTPLAMRISGAATSFSLKMKL